MPGRILIFDAEYTLFRRYDGRKRLSKFVCPRRRTGFSGTAKFLYEHGFKKENVYDLDAFKGTPAYERGKYWWGVNDKPVFELFKEKLPDWIRELHFGGDVYA